MPQPMTPSTVGEAAAEPEQIDYPKDVAVIDLPADTTESPGITDTGYIWDQTFPGEDDPMPSPDKPRTLAVRVSDVSDSVIFGAAAFVQNTGAQLLVPAHRDRLRVTIQVPAYAAAEPGVYLGHSPDIQPGFSAWSFMNNLPLVLETRGQIWVATGAGTGSVRVQWAIETVAEGCGCPLSDKVI